MCGGFTSAFKETGPAISCFCFALFVLFCFVWHEDLGDLQGLLKFKQTLIGQDLELGRGMNVLRIGQFKTNLGQKSEGVGSFGTSLSAKF